MDADDDWDFHTRFDLVHTRLMNGFGLRSWPHFYGQAFSHMAPGGWVENQEFDMALQSDDNTIPPDGAIRRWEALWNQGISRLGGSGKCYPQVMKRQMEEAGFINVHVQQYKLPMAPWAKDKRLRQAGLYSLNGFLEGLSGLSIRVFTGGLGWSIEELEVLLMEVRRECKMKSMHAYWAV